MTTTTPSANLQAVGQARPRSGWKQSAGFVAGGLLSLTGLVLAAAAAIPFVVRAAAGQAVAEPAWWVGARCVCGLMLVLLGFCVMVLNARDGEARTVDTLEDAQQPAVFARMTTEELLCGRCGAANDNLARFCDQCGRRL